MTFIVYNLLTPAEAQYAYDGIRQWFKDNPNKKECATEAFVVHRNSIKEDILKNSEAGTVISEEEVFGKEVTAKSVVPPDPPKKKTVRAKKIK